MEHSSDKHVDHESTNTVQWSRTSDDYARHRAPFPPAFFSRLAARGLLGEGLRALDVGTGTGGVAQGLAHRGLEVVGVDIAPGQIEQARHHGGGLVDYRVAPAEATGCPDSAFDLVFAGQCWHWFDRPAAAAEAWRVLKPGGTLVIGHFDWLTLPGSLVARTVDIVRAHRQVELPQLDALQVNNVYPHWLGDLAEARFAHLETFSFDLDVAYTREAWRGRMRASAFVGASMNQKGVERFDTALAAMLEPEAEPLAMPHRVSVTLGEKAEVADA